MEIFRLIITYIFDGFKFFYTSGYGVSVAYAFLFCSSFLLLIRLGER